MDIRIPQEQQKHRQQDSSKLISSKCFGGAGFGVCEVRSENHLFQLHSQCGAEVAGSSPLKEKSKLTTLDKIWSAAGCLAAQSRLCQIQAESFLELLPNHPRTHQQSWLVKIWKKNLKIPPGPWQELAA